MIQEKITKIEKESLTYYDELYRVCLARVNFNEEAAESCVQDTYLAFEEALKNGSSEIIKCRNWLFAVLYTHIKKYYKEKNEDSLYKMNLDNLYQAEENGIQFVDKSIDIAWEIEQKERNKSILIKAKQLKERDRKLLINVYFEGRKLTEIAKDTGESISSIKKQHERLKKKLSKIYYDDIAELQEGGEHK